MPRCTTDCVRYSNGPGTISVFDWRELWSAIFRVVAFAMHIEANGACTCGCTIRECDYCAHECMVRGEG
jgi:hypothetical protein